MGRKFLSDIREKRRAKRAERQGWRALTGEEADRIRETGELPEGTTDAFLPAWDWTAPSRWKPEADG